LYRHQSTPGVATKRRDIERSNTHDGTTTNSSKDKKKVKKASTDSKVGLKSRAFDADDDDEEEEDINESHRSVYYKKQDASESNSGGVDLKETPAETGHVKKEKKERRKSHKSHKKKHSHKESKRHSKKLDDNSILSANSGDNTESETEAEPTESAIGLSASEAARELALEETTTVTEDTTAATEDTTSVTNEATATTEDTMAATEETMAVTAPMVASEPGTATESAAEGPTVKPQAKAEVVTGPVTAEGPVIDTAGDEE
jgi:hypothetical protein